MSDLAAVVLAAGKGTRMKSKLPKVLHSVLGKPMLEYVLDAADVAGCKRKIVVLGFGADEVTPLIDGRAEVAVQKEQLGTGHAVMMTEELLKDFSGTIMITCGDTPLLDGRDLKALYEHHIETSSLATVFTAVLPDATGYGRIVRGENDNVIKIVEQKDATIKELEIKEINTGIYCIESAVLFDLLRKIDCNNAQGEYYLTDVIAKLVETGGKVSAVAVSDPDTILGINSREQLAEAVKLSRMKTNKHLMDSGVTIIDPDNTYIEANVKIGADTIIYPNTYILGNSAIGQECAIGPNTRFNNVIVGDNCHIFCSYANDATVGSGVDVGPYAHLRPGTRLADNVKIGNFVEVKNSWLGVGTKVSHLSYVGDADIGSQVNMGCGTITVNYDGKKKYRTIIEDNVFVGCNSNLVAPVTLHESSYIGAGSTITVDVPANALAVGRTKQKNIGNWNKKK